MPFLFIHSKTFCNNDDLCMKANLSLFFILPDTDPLFGDIQQFIYKGHNKEIYDYYMFNKILIDTAMYL